MGLKSMPPMGPDLQEHRKRIGAEKNGKVLRSGEFIEACAAAGIPATKRQARKFRQKVGLAWRNR